MTRSKNSKMGKTSGVEAIQKHGILLVFPIQNRKEPASLWSSFYPRTAMRWEWDDGADGRVADLWHLREELSRSGKVVYAKWFKNRATFFSPDCFRWVRAVLKGQPGFSAPSADARRIFGIIGDNSPSSMKEVKKAAKSQHGLAGPVVEKSMADLWQRLWITGYGEVDDGAFPSLAVGTSEQLFEKWCDESDGLSAEEGRRKLEKKLGAENLFLKELDRVVKKLQGAPLLEKITQDRPSRTKKLRKLRSVTYEDLVGKT